MVAALFAVAFAALPPSGGGTWLELSAAVRIDAGTLHRAPTTADPLTSGDWAGGGAAAAIEVFGRRVVDDDAAPALQPFLQRAARFGLEGGGRAADLTYPIYIFSSQEPTAFDNRFKATEQGGQVAMHADGYLRRWLWGAMRFGVDYLRWMPQPFGGQTIGGIGNVTPVSSGSVAALLNSSELMLTGAAAIGGRWRDLLLSAGWNVTAFRVADDALRVRFWGGAFVDVHAVAHRSVELDFHVEALDGGAAGQGAVTVWLRRRYGLSAGVGGGYGAPVDSPTAGGRAGGHVGVAAWLTPRLSMALSYSATWQSGLPIAGLGTDMPDSSQWSSVAHVITLSATARPR